MCVRLSSIGVIQSLEILELVPFLMGHRGARCSDLYFGNFHKTNYGRDKVIIRILHYANSHQSRLVSSDSQKILNICRPAVSIFRSCTWLDLN